MEQTVEVRLVLSIQAAEAGIDYNTKDGALCPWCENKLKVVDTKPWSGDCRVRYQKCINEKCPLSVMDKSIKTVQSVTPT